MRNKLFFTSSGTGGHIFPTISVAKFFEKEGFNSIIVTDEKGHSFINKIFKNKIYLVNTKTPTNKNILYQINSLFYIFFSFLKFIFIMYREKPKLVFGLGGYVTFPICLAAFILRIPFVIYENNAILGRTNKYLLPFAKKIFTNQEQIINLPKKYSYKIIKSGNILREEILKFKNISKKKNSESAFVLSILGGSQGAKIFAKIVPPIIKSLKEEGHDIKIIQQCQNIQLKQLSEYYGQNKIDCDLFDFTNNIGDKIIDSDLAISRSGSSTLAELLFLKIPFIAIPYKYAIDNHQFENAIHYKNKGYCWVIEESNFDERYLINLIKKILQDKSILNTVKEKMQKTDDFSTNFKIKKEIDLIIKNEN